MKLSIRTRLTMWYVTLLVVSLLAFSGSFFYAISKVFLDDIDAEIESVAEMMMHTVIQPTGEVRVPRNFEMILESFFGVRTAGNYIQVIDSTETVVARSASLKGFSIPFTDKSKAVVKGGIESYELIDIPGRYPVRVVTKPIILKTKGVVGVVQVASSLEGVEKIFHHLLYFMVIGIIAAVLVAGVIGSFLALKALRPVDEITVLARRIGAESLDERLDVHNPRDEIGRLATTFNDMIERLESSFNQIQQFTADASHELKTPLTVLKGEIEVALRGDMEAAELKDVLVSSLEEIDRMSYIVKNLLDLARSDIDAESGTDKEVALDGILTERVEQLKKKAVEKGVELNVRANAALVVIGDPIRLGQLIYNLVDNAIKYTERDGLVDLFLEEGRSFAILRVRDSGEGIDEKDQPFIFDRFYRVDKARTSTSSSFGLGLSICSEIVKAHGGEISVKSELGEGSEFTVSLPYSKGE